MGEKYNKELKIRIVREHSRGYSTKFLSDKFDIAHATIKTWCRQYHMYGEAGIEKSLSKTKYSGEFKRSVLNYKQLNKMSYAETAIHFSIKHSSTIANWQKIYDTKGVNGLNGSQGRPKKEGASDMVNKKRQPRKLTQSELEELIVLREKNQLLEAELAYLKKLDALIQKKSLTKKKPKSF